MMPFRFLAPFGVDEAPIFTGREEETARLLAWIRDPDVRVVLLCGPPACGKTSLWNAGVCAALRHAEQRAVRFSGAGDAADALRAAVAAEAEAEVPAAAILLDEVDEALALPVTGRRARLEEAVLELAAAPRRFALVIELRSDLRGELAGLEERLGPACRALSLRPLDEARLARALEVAAGTGPAFEWETGLPRRIAADVLAVSDHTGEPPLAVAQLIGHTLHGALTGARTASPGRIVSTDYEEHVGSASWLIARWLEEKLGRAHHAKRRGIAAEMLGALTLARPGGLRVPRTLVEDELTLWPDHDVARVVLFNLVMDGLVVRAADSARYRLVSSALAPVIDGWVLAGDQVERATRVLVESQKEWEREPRGEPRVSMEIVARVNARLARLLGERYPTPAAALSRYVRTEWVPHAIGVLMLVGLYFFVAQLIVMTRLTVDSPEGATTVALRHRNDATVRRLAMPVRNATIGGETQVDVIGAGLVTDRRRIVPLPGAEVQLTAWTPPVRRVWSAPARGAGPFELEDVNADGALDVVLCGDEAICGTALDGRTGAPLTLASTRLRFDDLWSWDPYGFERDRWRTHEVTHGRDLPVGSHGILIAGPEFDAVLSYHQWHWGSQLHALRVRPELSPEGYLQPAHPGPRRSERSASRKPVVRDNSEGEWRRETDHGAHLRGFAVADLDRDGYEDVVTATEAGGLHAIDGRDGTTLWSYRAGGQTRSRPLLGDVDGDGMLDAVFIAGGRVEVVTASVARVHTAWRGHHLVANAERALDDFDGDGTLDLFEHVRHHVKILSGLTGAELARVPTWIGPTLLPGTGLRDAVVVWQSGGPEPSRIFRHRRASENDVVWERSLEMAYLEVVAIVGGRILVKGQNGVAALDKDTGATAWWTPASSPPTVRLLEQDTWHATLLIEEPGSVRALDPATGRERWAIRRPHARILGSGLPARPRLIVGTDREALLVDARDGTVAWTAVCRRKPLAAAVARHSVDDSWGRACVLEEGGTVVVRSLGHGNVLAEIPVDPEADGLESAATSSKALVDVVAIGPRMLQGVSVRLPQVLWTRTFEHRAGAPEREDLDLDGTLDFLVRAGDSVHAISGDTGRGLFAVHDLGVRIPPVLLRKPGAKNRRLLAVQTARSAVVLELPAKLAEVRPSFPAPRSRNLGPLDVRVPAESCRDACWRPIREEDFLAPATR